MSFSKPNLKIAAVFIGEHFPNGFVNAPALLELARPKKSVIHRMFQWDDGIAAEEYRLYQARNIIRSITVVIDERDIRKYVQPLYIEEFDSNQYVELTVAKEHPELWKEVLARALQEAISWKNRYEHLKELSVITKAIEEVVSEESRSAGSPAVGRNKDSAAAIQKSKDNTRRRNPITGP